ncbi:MAG: DUF1232 domain-containing protein [Frankia sp.]|nr:DUF1232 domain-containing protein [Frankia sp.]
MVSVDKDALRSFGREVATFVPDLVAMLRGLVADPDVPQSAKLQAGAALAYLVSPKNRVTNMIPLIGQLDDVAVLAIAFNRLAVGAGEKNLRRHWRGNPRTLQLLINASGVLAAPAGKLRNVKIASTLAGAAFSKLGARTGIPGLAGLGGLAGFGGARRPGAGQVVDGEVIGRADADPVGAAGSAADGPRAAWKGERAGWRRG